MSEILPMIGSNIIGIIILLFTIFIVGKSTILSEKKINYYIFTSILVILIIIFETISIFIAQSNVNSLRPLHIFVNMAGFSLCPFVPLLMTFIYDDELYKKRFIFSIPGYIQIILCTTSPITGWIFYVSKFNVYSRGPYFFVNLAINLYGLIIFIYANYRSAKYYEKDEKIHMDLLYIIVLLGIMVQIIFPDILILWSSVALSMLLYYIFLQELQLKFDLLTNVRNRMAFEKKIMEIENADTVGIVVIDLNNLKKINDTQGHLEGDTYLATSGRIIQESFKDLGTTYRIGGDEFCVLCKNVDENQLKQAFKSIEDLSTIHFSHMPNKFALAYGYNIYHKTEGITILESFRKADEAMYVHKRKIKYEII